jgi:hypothetical protein
MEHLPIVPETWKMKPNAKTKKQLTVVKGLLQKSNLALHTPYIVFPFTQIIYEFIQS